MMEPVEKCGIFGIFGHLEASNLTYLGLYSLQHRGQESAGIVSSDGSILYSHRGMGLVSEVFTRNIIDRIPGDRAIGHVRYSTAGASHIKNAQPFVVEYARGSLAVAHNGNLTNASRIRDELEAYGSIFQSTMDTEVIIHLIAQSRERSLADRVVAALQQVQGAYSLLFLNEEELIAVRDPNGFRPLALGKLDDAYVVASETCAFDLIGATYLREVEPGEVLIINERGLESMRPFEKTTNSLCVFEFIYFARPDSVVFDRSVYSVRLELGRQLAREHPVEADVVVPIPDSGFPASIGYAMESGIPLELGLIRNHYVGRTFIEPEKSIRHFGVKIKLNPVKDVIKGKRVILVDDSIVRATTGRKIVKMIRNAGADEVHARISSPPITDPCFYGIDTPLRKELIAASHKVDEICTYLTTDSLGYLSEEGLRECVGEDHQTFCYACFTGDYPVPIPAYPEDTQMALFEKI
ncbi:MAG: amidophosphoribosyltransferase [Proteobacteria bacterium]|nr:amidophosphoribosyltransferase [Pseudomonadota bacterium]NIS70836.1 amidophosphoribosyltransferase [Pseudomonadota bacterium]